MTDFDKKDLATCIDEIKGRLAELETAYAAGVLPIGVVISTRDILTRFTIPRLEAITE